MPKDVVTVPRSKTWRRVRKRTIAFALFVAIICVGFAGYVWVATSASSMVRTQKRIATQDDPNWRLADYDANRIRVTDLENSAFQVERIQKLMPARWLRQRKVPSPSFEGGTIYEKELISFVADEVSPEVLLDPFLTSWLKNEQALVQEAVVEARALSRMPLGRPTLIYLPNPAAILLPQVDRTRRVSRLIRADILMRSQDGDIDGALESCIALLNAARSIGDEPFLVSQMARVSIGGSACTEIQRVLALGEASDAALARIQTALAEESKYSMLLVAMRGERATLNDEFEKLTTGELDMNSLGGAPAKASSWNPGMPAVFFQYNHALILRCLNIAIDIAKKPDSEHRAAWRKFEDEAKPAEGQFLKAAGVLSSLYTTAISASGSVHLRYRASLSTAMTIIACERHRLAHGDFPSSCEELEPRFKLGMIGDPYMGGPIKFKREMDRLVVYSLGEDGQDDGGKLATRSKDKLGFDLGLTLWNPSARRKQPKNMELPVNVFQAF